EYGTIQIITPSSGIELGDTQYDFFNIIDNDSAVVAIGNASTTEGNVGTKNLAFTISLSKPSDRDVYLQFDTADGSATAGSDFLGQSSVNIIIPAFETSVTRNVVLLGDTAYEPNETFTATLSDLDAQDRDVTLGTATATGTIVNDDPVPVNLSV